MTGIVTLLLIIFILYAFAGIIAFAPYLGALIGSIFHFFLDLIKFNIYPVGDIVYIVLSGILVFIVVMFFIRLIKHS